MWGCGLMAIVEGPSSFVVIDPGYDAAQAQAVTGTSVAGLVDLCDGAVKPVEYVILTHHHWDRVYNLRVLEQFWPHLRVVAHARTPLSHPGLMRIDHQTELALDEVAVALIPAPGHSELGDDLAVLLYETRVLLCGDVWQPQGASYEHAGALSPVPFYHHGRAYLDSLARLAGLGFDVLRTGDGVTVDRAAALSGFEVTRRVVLRTQEVALEALAELPGAELDEMCWWVFERVAAERGWSPADVLARRSAETYPGAGDYERFDRPGIAYWVKEGARVC